MKFSEGEIEYGRYTRYVLDIGKDEIPFSCGSKVNKRYLEMCEKEGTVSAKLAALSLIADEIEKEHKRSEVDNTVGC